MSFNPISFGDWDVLQKDATFIRQQVFILEQNIAAEDEWDEQDQLSLHFVMYDQKHAIATARLLQNNSIGRVAVLKAYRGKGIGRTLMLDIIQQAQKQAREYLKLSAQTHAISFYAGLGFQVEGEHYLECGIPHVNMIMKL